MNKLERVFLLCVVALMTTMTANAKIQLGLQGGLNVTNMSLSTDVLKESNQTGFFLGPSIRMNLPIIGVGFDISALYDQRDAQLTSKKGTTSSTKTVHHKAFNVPLNLRYNLGLGSMASIYFAAGPQVSFALGDKDISITDTRNYELRNSNFSVNVGAGISLMKHLEVGARYNVACGKTADVEDVTGAVTSAVKSVAKSHANAWQISLSYYF